MNENKKRVLVIEDNEADASVIQDALAARTDCEVTRFVDGADALAALLNDSIQLPDAILLDLNLPRSEGLDILLAIRNTPRLSEIPVGILTSSQLPSDELRASLIGAVCYVHKPFSYEQFVNRVRQAIAGMVDG